MITKEQINELRKNKKDSEIAILLGVSRQRIGQVAGPRKNSDAVSKTSDEQSQRIVRLIKSGYSIAECRAMLNMSVGRIRSIVTRAGIKYGAYEKVRTQRRLDKIGEAISGLIKNGVELKTTSLIKANRNLYARAMREGGIGFWRKRLERS